MKPKMKPILAAALVATVALMSMSCGTSGTTATSTTTDPARPMPTPAPNANPVVTNPIVAYVGETLTDFAFNQAQAYVNNYLFGPKSAKRNAPTIDQDMEKTVAAAKAKFPKEPDAKIRAVVKREYSAARTRRSS